MLTLARDLACSLSFSMEVVCKTFTQTYLEQKWRQCCWLGVGPAADQAAWLRCGHALANTHLHICHRCWSFAWHAVSWRWPSGTPVKHNKQKSTQWVWKMDILKVWWQLNLYLSLTVWCLLTPRLWQDFLFCAGVCSQNTTLELAFADDTVKIKKSYWQGALNCTQIFACCSHTSAKLQSMLCSKALYTMHAVANDLTPN